uniref:Rad60/SUMO-like domain-containing protein n=1 Tax=Chenopodium quinoa TaxID=63459 RepID=A0A803N9W4_CHEQI
MEGSSTKKKGSGRGENKNILENDKIVKVRVVKENTKDVSYKIKRDFALGRLMFDYCQTLGVDYKGFKFTYLGKQISEFDTPNLLQMEDEEDVIDCWADQIGGHLSTI